MDLFTIDGTKVTPLPNTLMIDVFRRLWERDKTKGKDNASREFAYIEFLLSYKKDNPYAGYEESIKESKVRTGVFGANTEWEPDDLVLEAIAIYIDFRDKASPNLRLYLAALKAADELKNYLENIDMNERTRQGAMLLKPADVARALKEMSALMTSMETLKQKVQQELFEAGKVRANRTVNPFER